MSCFLQQSSTQATYTISLLTAKAKPSKAKAGHKRASQPTYISNLSSKNHRGRFVRLQRIEGTSWWDRKPLQPVLVNLCLNHIFMKPFLWKILCDRWQIKGIVQPQMNILSSGSVQTLYIEFRTFQAHFLFSRTTTRDLIFKEILS